jgi:D-alanyl-D-alanine dipeptidase
VRPTSRPSSTAAKKPAPTPLSAAARAAGLIDIRTVVPDAIVDLRYRTSDNFTKVRLYPLDARCLVHRSMAPGLVTAARKLRRTGDLLVFWDCYRPHAVQERMFRIVPDPDWVARPGPFATSHEAGRSVDVTLARADPKPRCADRRRVQGHCLLAMGTGFDDFTPRAYAYATARVSTAAQANRARLRTAMADGGISVYRGEWWHFDGPGALTPRPHLHAALS